MSTGLHLNKETQDLIKNIGESRSKQDEDNLIRKDIEKLKKKIHETPYEKMTNTRQIREIAIRAIYADMLGHDVSFCHFFLINMTNSKNLNVKRAGYLACWLLLGEDNDLKIMLVATLQRDLKSESAYEVLIALNSLNKLMNHTNINNLIDDVVKHLNHNVPLIRKKAFCLLQKMIKINPKAVPNWEMKLREGLGDKEPSVMGVCLNMYYQDLLENPDKHKDILKILVTIMNLILDVKLPRDYDFQRIPAPWFQIRILQIFGIICQNDKKNSEEVYPVVEKALRRSDDTMTDIGYAVAFQAIKTITKLYANQSLLEKASKTIGKFFQVQPANVKINRINLFYMGVESMRSLVNINPKYATKHQVYIVDCLQHPDESIRRPTLDLLYKTTNTSNLDVVMDKLLFYLRSTNDERFKQDLVTKIYELNERLAPNPDWFVKKTNVLFQYGNECIDEAMLSRTIKIIEENLTSDSTGEFGGLLLQNYYEFLDKPIPSQLVKLISWIFAEVGVSLYSQDPTSLNQLGTALVSLFRQRTEGAASTKKWILTSLAKLCACEGFDDKEAQQIFGEMQDSVNPELKERAMEYSRCPEGIQSLAQINNYDFNLSFLRGAIVRAVESGLPKYDPTKLNISLVISRPEPSQSELPTQHREVKLDEETGIPNTPAEEPEAKLAPPKKNFFKKAGESEGPAPVRKEPEPVKIMNNLSDKKPESTEAQQKVEKKEKIANKFFGGMEESNPLAANKLNKEGQKKPTFLKPAAKTGTPTPSTTQNPVNQTSTSSDLLDLGNPTPTGPKAPQLVQNLLDLDLGGGSTPTPGMKQPTVATPTTGNLLDNDLLGGDITPTTPADDTPKKTPGGSKFVKPSFKPPTPKADKALSPFPISEEQYENYWTQFSIERKEVIKSTNIRTQSEFNQMAKTIGFHITSTIDTDNICAAKFTDKIVLFYGKFKVSGEVEVMLNSNDKEAVDFALESIKKYCAR